VKRINIQQRGPDGKGCLEGEFFCPLLSTTNRIKIKRTKMFELPRHPFPGGTGFAEYLFTVTDFSDSPEKKITGRTTH
jgi:hypothetical protein